MSGTIYKAASGALLQQMRLDVLSNNLANINTVGFKADTPVFRVTEERTGNAPLSPTAGKLSPYAPPFEHRIDFSGGQLKQTGNRLDLAIAGDGFFEIQTPEGLQYTRKGSFSINENGQLSTAQGWPVMGQGGAITIDSGDFVVNAEGEVLVDGTATGQIRIVDFDKPYDLQKVGDTLFKPTQADARARDAEGCTLSQGFVETSNVNAIRTMAEIIETTRVFETYQRVMRSSDEATSKTVNDVGRSA